MSLHPDTVQVVEKYKRDRTGTYSFRFCLLFKAQRVLEADRGVSLQNQASTGENSDSSRAKQVTLSTPSYADLKRWVLGLNGLLQNSKSLKKLSQMVVMVK